jgi:hypothetical protein
MSFNAFVALLLSLVLGHQDATSAFFHRDPAAPGADRLFRAQYDVPVVTPDGAHYTVRVHETFTVRSLLRRDKRDMLLIPGTIGNAAAMYETPIEGYDMSAVLARQGLFVSAIDLLGVGDSSHPASGAQLNTAFSVPYVAEVAAELAILHGVPRVDIYGETGSGTASIIGLSSRPDLVRTVSGSGLFYRSVNVGIAPLLSEAWLAVMDSSPGDYVPFPSQAYQGFFAPSPASVQAFMYGAPIDPSEPPVFRGALPAFYPDGFFRDLYACRPAGPDPAPGTILAQTVVDPSGGAVPALFLQGGSDLVALPGDSAALAADYGSVGGGHADAVTIAGGSHFVRYDASGGAEMSHGPGDPFTSAWASNLIPFILAH